MNGRADLQRKIDRGDLTELDQYDLREFSEKLTPYMHHYVKNKHGNISFHILRDLDFVEKGLLIDLRDQVKSPTLNEIGIFLYFMEEVHRNLLKEYYNEFLLDHQIPEDAKEFFICAQNMEFNLKKHFVYY